MAVQDYIDHVLNALPKWFSNRDRSFENVKAFAEIFQDAEDQSVFWRSQANILDAVGPSVGEPDWLNQHAVDRGTRRQDNESDVALRDRLRTFPDALTFNTLLAAAQSVVDEEGIVGTVTMFELRPNRAFFVDLDDQLFVGGTIAGTAPDMTYTPPSPLKNLALLYDTTASHRILFISSGSAGNDGVFEITGVVGDSVTYSNPSGVAEGAGIAIILREDAAGNSLDNNRQSYFSRGYRMASAGSTLVVILPFGCTEGTRLAVLESFRQKKGAGVRVIVECRQNP